MFINGENERFEAGSTDEIQASPLCIRRDWEDGSRTLTWRTTGIQAIRECFGVVDPVPLQRAQEWVTAEGNLVYRQQLQTTRSYPLSVRVSLTTALTCGG